MLRSVGRREVQEPCAIDIVRSGRARVVLDALWAGKMGNVEPRAEAWGHERRSGEQERAG